MQSDPFPMIMIAKHLCPCIQVNSFGLICLTREVSKCTALGGAVSEQVLKIVKRKE